MHHEEILALAADQPVRHLAPGEILIVEGELAPGVFILQSGTVEVRRDGQLVAVVDRAGSLLGEMAMLLESPSTADVVARDHVACHQIAAPEVFFADNPELALFLARVLAQRLHAVNGYLAELKERFGDADNHLGLASAVVDQLLASRGTTIDPEAVGPSDEELAALDE